MRQKYEGNAQFQEKGESEFTPDQKDADSDTQTEIDPEEL